MFLSQLSGPHASVDSSSTQQPPSLCVSCAFHRLNLCLVHFQWDVFSFLFSALQGVDYAVIYTSKKVCGLRKSTVDINCTYKFPASGSIKESWWFTKEAQDKIENDADYASRVKYNCTPPSCNGMSTLRIEDLRQSDSAEYKFRFITDIRGGSFSGIPGVTLSVTGKIEKLSVFLQVCVVCILLIVFTV